MSGTVASVRNKDGCEAGATRLNDIILTENAQRLIEADIESPTSLLTERKGGENSLPASPDPVRAPLRADKNSPAEAEVGQSISGVLLKRATVHHRRWQEREFHVWPSGMCWYKRRYAIKASGYIPTEKLLRCTDAGDPTRPGRFDVECPSRVIQLDAKTSGKKTEWLRVLRINMRLSAGHKGAETWRGHKLRSLPYCAPRRTIDLKTCDSMAQTGDILLFRTKGARGSVNRLLTWALIDHVAVVIRHQGHAWVLEAVAATGVASHKISMFKRCEWCDQYESTQLRRLRPQLPPKIAHSFLKVAKQLEGRTYSLFGAVTRRSKTHANQESFFCSELVAYLYQQVGLLRPYPGGAAYMPKHLSESFNLNLLNGFKLGPSIELNWGGS